MKERNFLKDLKSATNRLVSNLGRVFEERNTTKEVVSIMFKDGVQHGASVFESAFLKARKEGKKVSEALDIARQNVNDYIGEIEKLN